MMRAASLTFCLAALTCSGCNSMFPWLPRRASPERESAQEGLVHADVGGRKRREERTMSLTQALEPREQTGPRSAAGSRDD